MPAPAIIAAAAMVTAGSMYTASQQSKAAKKAAESEENIARMEIEAANKAQQTAAEEAKAKLKLRQASQTQTILSNPNDEVNTNETILGV